MVEKPRGRTSETQKELDKAEQQFEQFESQVRDLTMDRMNAAPKPEKEELKIAAIDLEKSKDIILKPERIVGPGVNHKTGEREKFNEDFRKEYEFMKEQVRFIAQNHEIIGEAIEIWTKPFPGLNSEFWKVPVNKPVWGPRYLAEQLKRKYYHRLKTENSNTGADATATYYGTMVVDTTVQRLDAMPVSTRKSVFMGASGF